jgi:hypothetical protein
MHRNAFNVKTPHRTHFGFRISDFEFVRAQFRNPKSEIPNPSRGGSTLTEVLVALMIMSIGLVSLAVLFPMSVLRSIKASQFTNATDTRFNAEAMIDVFPNLVKNPDYTFVAGVPNAHPAENFVVDPLGFAIINQSSPILSQYFGNADPSDQILTNPPNANPAIINPNSWTFRRYSGMQLGTIITEPLADHLVTLPDSWVFQFEAVATAGTIKMDPKATVPTVNGATQLDVPGLGALGIPLSASNALRAVIFSGDGITSHARTITSMGAVAAGDTVDTIKWTEDSDSTGTLTAAKDFNGNGVLDDNSLPPSFVTGASGIGKVRIEQQERRYTWLLTVRKNNTGTQGDVDVVVFFKRPFDEFQKSIKGYAGDEVLIQAAFQQGNTQVSVQYPIANKPFMRKGNYIFDANNAFWYRISNVSTPTQTTLPGNVPGESVTITLDVPANASSPLAPIPARAMFPRAVVDVYPIGTKS